MDIYPWPQVERYWADPHLADMAISAWLWMMAAIGPIWIAIAGWDIWQSL